MQRIPPSEITPESLFQQRRQFMRHAIGAGLLAAAPLSQALSQLPAYQAHKGGEKESLTSFSAASSYNNFYEFGTAKGDPAENAHRLVVDPWSLQLDGALEKPRRWALEDLIKQVTLEERIYRLRCVEGWSMVIPWIGFPLSALIKTVKPLAKARFIKFETALEPDQMSGVKWPVLQWPYAEGLRMDEAMHPLTLIAVGMYDRVLPKQNGAPLRLVVPWKYGFKSIKSIRRLVFQEHQPVSSWSRANPREYGFYSNVNPDVSHPRWSQAKERRIGEFFKRPTALFNGYEEVAPLYTGMDLRRSY